VPYFLIDMMISSSIPDHQAGGILSISSRKLSTAYESATLRLRAIGSIKRRVR
jgi:hypothetical protein